MAKYKYYFSDDEIEDEDGYKIEEVRPIVYERPDAKTIKQLENIIYALNSPGGLSKKEIKVFKEIINELDKKHLSYKTIYNNMYEATILTSAIYTGNVDLVNFLFKQGVDGEQCIAVGNDILSPLQYAIMKSTPGMVKCLLENKVSPNMSIFDNGHQPISPLIFAIGENKPDLVELLIKYGAEVNSLLKYNNSEKTALHFAIDNGQKEIVKILLDNGADPNQKSLEGGKPRLPLMHAIITNQKEIVEHLLSKEADSNLLLSFDGLEISSLHYAIFHKSDELTKLLLEKGGNPLVCKLLFKACLDTISNTNSPSLIDLFIKKAAENDEGLEVLEVLLSSGMEIPKFINLTNLNEYGATALHIAVRHNNMDLVRYIVENNLVDIDACDKNGLTAFNYAEYFGYADEFTKAINIPLRVNADVDHDSKVDVRASESYYKKVTNDGVTLILGTKEEESSEGSSDLGETRKNTKIHDDSLDELYTDTNVSGIAANSIPESKEDSVTINYDELAKRFHHEHLMRKQAQLKLSKFLKKGKITNDVESWQIDKDSYSFTLDNMVKIHEGFYIAFSKKLQITLESESALYEKCKLVLSNGIVGKKGEQGIKRLEGDSFELKILGKHGNIRLYTSEHKIYTNPAGRKLILFTSKTDHIGITRFETKATKAVVIDVEFSDPILEEDINESNNLDFYNTYPYNGDLVLGYGNKAALDLTGKGAEETIGDS